jgi:rhamnose utilization protein RhaD (predicted bifunctional aldolase and dehydrogenase)
MKEEIEDIIEVSQYYGKQKDYTLGGGGNTSYKDQDHIYVKASGHSLATITQDGFAVLDREKLQAMVNKKYSEDPQTREYEVKEDLMASRIDPDSNLRPSVETSLHEAINYAFVVHMHPHMINGLLCSKNAESAVGELFGDKGIYVQYTDPGMILFRKVLKLMEEYREIHSKDPNYIFLQNHGVFVSADSVEEIHELYQYIDDQLMSVVKERIKISNIDLSNPVQENVKVLTDYLSEKKFIDYRYDSLIQRFTSSQSSLCGILKPFIPDQIVYCKAFPLIISQSESISLNSEDLASMFSDYRKHHGFDPKVVLFEKGPLVAIEESKKSADLVLDMFEDAMRISYYSDFFGGPNFMSDEQIAFIENWEVEHYRQKIAKGI